jgi:anti-sigma B factor antagonist
MDTCSTIVVKLPECMTGKVVRTITRQIKPGLSLDHPCVIIDMSSVRQMDTAALDMLLRCMVEVARHDGELKLAGLSPEAATVLELTRMDRIFEIFPSVPEAVTSTGYELPQFETIPATAEVSPQPAAA